IIIGNHSQLKPKLRSDCGHQMVRTHHRWSHASKVRVRRTEFGKESGNLGNHFSHCVCYCKRVIDLKIGNRTLGMKIVSYAPGNPFPLSTGNFYHKSDKKLTSCEFAKKNPTIHHPSRPFPLTAGH